MHELSLALALVEQIAAAAQREKALRVTKITVQVGALAGVETEVLRSVFPLAAEDSLAADAELVLEKIPVVVFCPLCQKKSQPAMSRLCCAHCGSKDVQLRQGREFLIKAIEIES